MSEQERKEYINIILEETNRLLKLSNNILKLAKLQHQDKIINNEEINFLKRNFKINKLIDIFTLEKQQILEILNSKELNEFINKYKSTPKKWVRLRKTIEKKENKEIKEKTGPGILSASRYNLMV